MKLNKLIPILGFSALASVTPALASCAMIQAQNKNLNNWGMIPGQGYDGVFLRGNRISSKKQYCIIPRMASFDAYKDVIDNITTWFCGAFNPIFDESQGQFMPIAKCSVELNGKQLVQDAADGFSIIDINQVEIHHVLSLDDSIKIYIQFAQDCMDATLCFGSSTLQ